MMSWCLVPFLGRINKAALSSAQARIVELINSEKFTPEYCERFYKESPLLLCDRSRVNNPSYFVMSVREVNAFMAAVDGIIKSVR